jgi:hypothetical protein
MTASRWAITSLIVSREGKGEVIEGASTESGISTAGASPALNPALPSAQLAWAWVGRSREVSL